MSGSQGLMQDACQLTSLKTNGLAETQMATFRQLSVIWTKRRAEIRTFPKEWEARDTNHRYSPSARRRRCSVRAANRSLRHAARRTLARTWGETTLTLPRAFSRQSGDVSRNERLYSEAKRRHSQRLVAPQICLSGSTDGVLRSLGSEAIQRFWTNGRLTGNYSPPEFPRRSVGP